MEQEKYFVFILTIVLFIIIIIYFYGLYDNFYKLKLNQDEMNLIHEDELHRITELNTTLSDELHRTREELNVFKEKYYQDNKVMNCDIKALNSDIEKINTKLTNVLNDDTVKLINNSKKIIGKREEIIVNKPDEKKKKKPVDGEVELPIVEVDRKTKMGIKNFEELFEYLFHYKDPMFCRTTLNDKEEQKLFMEVDKDILKTDDYLKFISLLDNYERKRGIRETVTVEENEEVERFLDTIFEKEYMKYIYENSDLNKTYTYSELREQVKKDWFGFSDKGDTCLFEHVFIGELNKNKVTGYHNWIKYYFDEENNDVVIKKFLTANVSLVNYTKITFGMSWDNHSKPITGILVGVSPQMEFAMKILASYVCQENVKFKIDNNNVNIKVFRNNGRTSTIYFE